MAKKEFMYRGKKLEELQAMGLKDLAEIFPATQRRVIKRGFTEEQKRLLKKLEKSGSKPVKTHCRNMLILPNMVGKTIMVYSGKDFVPIMIQPEMISHRLGEYALTRKRVGHSSPGVGATRSSAAASVR